MATMSARYTVIDGEVVAQERSGVRHQLVPDPLGSVVALYDGSGTKTDTFDYWPYGESGVRTGTTIAKFQYVGSYGYYQDSSTKNYVRARYYRNSLASWISEDKLWIVSTSKYSYSLSSPLVNIDIDGLFPQRPVKIPTRKPPAYKQPKIPYCGCPWQAPCVKWQAMVADNEGAQYPGWHNGPGDALKHCVLSCRVLKNCGRCAFDAFVIAHEQENAWWLNFSENPVLIIRPHPPFIIPHWQKTGHNWDKIEGPMDLFNNSQGEKCADSISCSINDVLGGWPTMSLLYPIWKRQRSCEECCLKKKWQGTLIWLSPTTPYHPWADRPPRKWPFLR